MAGTRDDFSSATKKALAQRAGHFCSLKKCQASTIGPSWEGPHSVNNVGVAAHIAAAAPGPGARRYDPTMTAQARSSIENGIWLCQSCAKEVDSDEVSWPVARLQAEKREAEHRAKDALGKTRRALTGRGAVLAVAGVALIIAVVAALAASGASERRVPSVVDPGSWIQFRELSVYRVMPEPQTDGGLADHDSFVAVVLELKNDSQDRTFEVQDLGFEGRVAFVPVEGGGILRGVQGFGTPSQVVNGFNLRPGSRGWAAIQFPFLHHDTASAPLGGVMARFEGTWTVLVDGKPLVVTPTTSTEGTVFLSKWKSIIEDINLRLEPVLKQGGPRGAWERVPGH